MAAAANGSDPRRGSAGSAEGDKKLKSEIWVQLIAVCEFLILHHPQYDLQYLRASF